MASTLDQLKKAVPEQPRLAPHVKAAGQMRESAFVEPPWLLEREGEGYVQVPRPLYRIAERADGQRTLQDLAQDVSQTEGRGVSADNVRHLVATQLIPKGIVAASDGTVAHPPSARSALAIARMKTINPALLAGITGALRVLYWPPVLLLVLLASALTQVWLYVVHGVGASLHDAFYAPGFMVLVLTAIILSAGFHELGHAAALRYAGGNARSFGFGMYLMYPVFFTDVSDNYRLRRWARVRTDLGGFYFNLIFALGVFGLYVLTRQEVLLVMILLMNFEIIRQLLPIVRLDGYWTLADLTGIPDFYSRMGAFVRSMLPLRRDGSTRALPPLKWWGKAVFIGYIVVSVPALAFLSLLMLRSVPRVLMTAWDALGQQGQGFVQAQAGGHVLGMAGAVGQSLLLILPVAGLLFSLYRLVTGLGGYLWRWSAGSRPRRGLVTLGAFAFAGLVYFLWAPQIPFLGNSPLYTPATFEPIGPDERLSVGDALGGSIVQRAPGEDLPAWLPAWLAGGHTEARSSAGNASQSPANPPQPPAGANPAGTNPAGTNPAGTNPADTNPTGTNPAGTNPAGTNPAGTNPAGTNPAGTNPAGTNPAGTNPAGTNPAGTNPVGTNLPGSPAGANSGNGDDGLGTAGPGLGTAGPGAVGAPAGATGALSGVGAGTGAASPPGAAAPNDGAAAAEDGAATAESIPADAANEAAPAIAGVRSVVPGGVPAQPVATAVSGAVPAQPVATAVSRAVPAQPVATAVAGAVPAPPVATAVSGTVPAQPVATVQAAVSNVSGTAPANGAVPVQPVATAAAGSVPAQPVATVQAAVSGVTVPAPANGAAPAQPVATAIAGTVPAEPAAPAIAGTVPAEPVATAIASTVPAEPAGSVPAEPAATAVAGSVPAEPVATAVASTVPTEPVATAVAGTVPAEPVATVQSAVPGAAGAAAGLPPAAADTSGTAPSVATAVPAVTATVVPVGATEVPAAAATAVPALSSTVDAAATVPPDAATPAAGANSSTATASGNPGAQLQNLATPLPVP